MSAFGYCSCWRRCGVQRPILSTPRRPGPPLVGKWKHTNGEVASPTIEANRLHFTCFPKSLGYFSDKGFSFHADYGITSDHTIFGLVTRVEPPTDNRRFSS